MASPPVARVREDIAANAQLAPPPPLAAYPRVSRARIALVHDYLFEQGGAENVFLTFASLFPQAPIYTSVYNGSSVSADFAAYDVRPSFLQRLAREKRRAKALLPLYPLAFQTVDLTGYDLVLSSSSGFAKGVCAPVGARHVCYCHTPAHFIWDLPGYARSHDGGRFPAALLAAPLIPALKLWDCHTAQRVDTFIANSAHTAKRIACFYHREAEVLHPPVNLAAWKVSSAEGDYYLVVSRLVPYKRIDLAVRAFSRLGLPLRVIGDGPDRSRLQQLAGPCVRFEGRVTADVLAERYARCRALILPGVEDLGLTALEAQASGRPVIAYRAAGALETVVEGVTGAFFDEQTADALADIVRQVDVERFDSALIRGHAAEFDMPRFLARLLSLLERELAGGGRCLA